MIADAFAPWPHLDDEARAALEAMVQRIVLTKRWEAAYGFEITEAMRVVIAAHAALLVLYLPDGDEPYRSITSIVVHPTTITVHDEALAPLTAGVPGLVAAGPVYLDGEAEHRGAVFLSWDAVDHESVHPEGGEHVVYHEFAHRLDMVDHLSDGMPVIDDPAARRRWHEVCTAEFDALQHSPDPHRLLRDYAGTDPAEFFAVATEVFFTRGAALRDHKPELYEVLADFYGQDPAAWRLGRASR